jgi:glycosyltransferase involved in cell wall biosynthesis
MNTREELSEPLKSKVVWLTGSLGGRGVTVVAEQAAKAVAVLSAYDVHIVCVHKLPEDFCPIPGVTLHDLKLPRDDDEVACRGLYAWMKQEQPDVVLYNDIPAVEALWPYLPPEVRAIGVLHDVAFGWRRPFIEYQKALHGVSAVSPFVMDALKKDLTSYSGVLRTIDNGTEYPDSVERALPRKPLHLLFFGAIDRQKGAYDLPSVLRACRRLGLACSLSIIGGEADDLKEEVAQAAGPIEVNWLGRLPRKECFEQLVNCDVLLSLSRGESFGLVTVEAMSMGCVPVGYAEGGTRDIVISGESGALVPLCDFKGIAVAIQKLDQDRESWQQMSRAASQRAREVYSLEAMGQRYLELIDSVMASEVTVERLDFTDFRMPPKKYRRYATYVPVSVRKRISQIVACSPRLENFLRKYKGV